MSQFIRLQKLTTRSPSSGEPILFNKSDVLVVDEEALVDQGSGSPFTARRIILNGSPEYTFYTMVSLSSILTALGAINLTGGLGSGSTCAGNPGVLDIVTLDANYPMLEVRKVVNNIASQTATITFNPNFLLHALEHPYQDEDTEVQSIGLMVAMKAVSPRRFMITLTMDDLTALLEPIVIT